MTRFEHLEIWGDEQIFEVAPPADILHQLDDGLATSVDEKSVIAVFKRYLSQEFSDLGLAGPELDELNHRRLIVGFEGRQHQQEVATLSETLCVSIQQHYNLNRKKLFDDPAEGVEAYRIALLDVVELRMMTTQVDDLEQWLPSMLQVISGQAHYADDQSEDSSEVTTSRSTDALRQFVENACINPVLDADEFYTSPALAALKAHALLDAAAGEDIIDEIEVDELKTCLKTHFIDKFAVSR